MDYLTFILMSSDGAVQVSPGATKLCCRRNKLHAVPGGHEQDHPRPHPAAAHHAGRPALKSVSFYSVEDLSLLYHSVIIISIFVYIPSVPTFGVGLTMILLLVGLSCAQFSQLYTGSSFLSEDARP